MAYHDTYFRCEASCSAMDSRLQFIIDGECREACLQAFPFHNSTLHCVASCSTQSDEIFASLLDYSCASSCSSEAYQVTRNSQLGCENSDVAQRTIDFEALAAPIKACLSTCSEVPSEDCESPSCAKSCVGRVLETQGSSACLTSCATANLSRYSLVEALQLCAVSCSKALLPTASLICVDSCPSSYYQAVDEKYHQSYLRCEASCQDFTNKTFTNGSTCVSACSGASKLHNSSGFCLSSCST